MEKSEKREITEYPCVFLAADRSLGGLGIKECAAGKLLRTLRKFICSLALLNRLSYLFSHSVSHFRIMRLFLGIYFDFSNVRAHNF